MSKKLHQYLKKEKLPTKLCSGCGHGIILNAVLKSISDLELNMQEVVLVSESGCIGTIIDYVSCDTVHAPDGRAIAVACGIKKANSNLKVIVIVGDGSIGSSGANHLLHAAQKGVELTIICATNKVYALAGGFAAPTTPVGAITSTTPQGNTQPPIDLCKIAYAGGAHYIARTSVYHAKQLVKTIKIGVLMKGISFIEILSICPVEYGERNGFKTATEMLNNMRLNCVPSDIITSSEQRGVTDRIVIGEFTRKG